MPICIYQKKYVYTHTHIYLKVNHIPKMLEKLKGPGVKPTDLTGCQN